MLWLLCVATINSQKNCELYNVTQKTDQPKEVNLQIPKKLHEKTDQTQKLSISFSIPQQNEFLCNVHARRRSVDEELWIFG